MNSACDEQNDSCVQQNTNRFALSSASLVTNWRQTILIGNWDKGQMLRRKIAGQSSVLGQK